MTTLWRTLANFIWVLGLGGFIVNVLKRYWSGHRMDTVGWLGALLRSPFLSDDRMRLRLRPVSVNTYAYVLPTHLTEDGVFVKVLVENASELATESM